jgi:cold shock CspA family protein/ribosome-associated translation inhibitor RaiA
MQVPVEIAFRNYEHDDRAEAAIREHIDKLERLFQRLTSCRVRVDQRADNSRHTIPPVVRIELGIPGHKDIVVSHEPEHLQRKFQSRDLQTAINEAFRIAERRLIDWKGKQAEAVTDGGSEIENQFLGQIADMPDNEDFGFLMTKEGGLLYFHRNSVLSGDFDKLKRGDEVHYVEAVGDTGPVASKVRVKAA